MKIVFFSTSDSGGAGRAAYSIFNTLKKNHNCKFIVFRKETQFTDVNQITNLNRTGYLFNWLRNKVIDKLSFKKFIIEPKYDMLNLMESAPCIKLKSVYSAIGIKPDLIILNWISGFINSHDIKRLYKKYKAPIIWILHDYAPLTGGCHVAWDCTGFLKSCGKCPGLNSNYEKDKTNRVLTGKLNNLKDLPVFTSGWSEFILNKSRKSRIFKDRTLFPISPGIDSTLFSPSANKTLSKTILNIHSSDKVILFGANDIFSEYKGFRHLLSALAELEKCLNTGTKFSLVTFGKAQKKQSVQLSFKWISLGLIENPALAYQAADVFVAPTLQDTGPMTVCESLMCGVPVVGYPMGIIPDVITEGETGFIVEEANIMQLTDKIARILNLSEDEFKKMSDNCRKFALEKFSEKAQLQSLTNLFALLKTSQVN